MLTDDRVATEITPESSGYINDSPWYAFKVEPNGADIARITVRYSGGHHRYWPKISADGLTWYPMEDRYVRAADDRLTADIVVPLDGKPVWVSAHELVTTRVYDAWGKKLARTSGFTPEVTAF